jgi:hypothetical protein
MPLEEYKKGLNSLNQAKSKQESKQMMIKLNQNIELYHFNYKTRH